MSVLLLFVITLAGAMSSEVSSAHWQMLNGNLMPALALGTYLGFDERGIIKPKDKTLRNVVLESIDAGYRHFDTAPVYCTEGLVGEAINMKVAAGVVNRSSVFVTTKLWNTHHERQEVPVALRRSLSELGLSYVDLYLMHWPMGMHEDYSYSSVDFMETWRGMEDAVRLGLARSIGLSNFNASQLRRVLREASVKPTALQIEVHPQLVQHELVQLAQSEDLVVMGYSPFGALVPRPGAAPAAGPRLDNPRLQHMANKYGKTPAQILLRWQISRGVVPIPKTVTLSRLYENAAVFDFELEGFEVDFISSFDSHTRYTRPSFWQDHPYYPFEIVPTTLSNPFL